MKPENEQFLKDNYHHWQSVRDTQTLRLLDGPTRSKMVQVMNEEWAPGYTADLWCPPCVFDIITAVYSRFDAHIAEKAKAEALPEPETEPVVINEEPLKVKASFPKNDKKKKDVPRQPDTPQQ